MLVTDKPFQFISMAIDFLSRINLINWTVRSQECKQTLEYQNYLLLRDIGWSKLYSLFKCCSYFQHQSWLDNFGSWRHMSLCTDVYYELLYYWRFYIHTFTFTSNHLLLQLFTKHTKIIKSFIKNRSLNGLAWGKRILKVDYILQHFQKSSS
jgi:hypothetical protein